MLPAPRPPRQAYSQVIYLCPVLEPHRLPLEKFVSETISVDQVEEAFAKMGHGEVLRSVVTF